MTYEEICSIDTEPFDDEVLSDVYSNGYQSTVYMPWIHSLLLFHYFDKFDEVYGTHLMDYVDYPNYLVDVSDDGMDEDADLEQWINEAPSLLMGAMRESGWNLHMISTLESRIEEAFYYQENDQKKLERFHTNYNLLLDEEFYDSPIKTAFRQEEDTMREAKCCLDEGEMGIFWNPQLTDYLSFRKKNKDIVDAVCPREDAAIMRMEPDIWEPFMVFLVQQKREMDDWEYGVVVLGTDGYTWTDTSTINPNWIPLAVKMKFMLDLANEKICRYREQQEQLPAA